MSEQSQSRTGDDAEDIGRESGVPLTAAILGTILVAVAAFISGYGVGAGPHQPAPTTLDDTGESVTCDIWAANGTANAICFAPNGVNVTINNENDERTVTGNVSLYGLPTNATEGNDE